MTMDPTLQPTSDPAWVLSVDGYDSLLEGSVESRFAISNGFLGIRGGRAATRGSRWVVPSRTYVAGLFDTPGPDPASPALVPAADWMKLCLLLNGKPLVHHPGDVASHRMTLDMRRGALLSACTRLELAEVTLRLHTMRLVSLHERAIGLQLIHVEIEDGTVPLTLEASFEGAELGLEVQRLEQNLGLWHTQYSGKALAIAESASLQIDGKDLPGTPLGKLRESWAWATRPGQVISFQRAVAIVRGAAADDPALAARDKLAGAWHIGWRGVVSAHEAAWDDRWRCGDVKIDGDAAAQQALRFAVYHLNSAANPHDEFVSIGARALTGDSYAGHVFWDTEIFLLPFYTLTWPAAARALLMYRFHTLGGARAKAAASGWKGAMFAWESADTGAETCPEQVIGPDRQVVPILCGRQEQHISADVAYAVWHYWNATEDESFLCDAGAEIILETARFWASRVRREADGLCHIRGVIGPDEYHEDIDDSAYTNVMARWNISRALDVTSLLRQRWPDRWTALADKLHLDDDELEQWRGVADTICTGFDPATGLFEEFAGYFGLETIDLSQYSGRSVPMDVVLGRARTQKSQVVKQADIVALLGLLPDEFPGQTGAANFAYYEPRCDHGSSLSPAMHGLVAARLGHVAMALRYFRQAAAIDLSDAHVGIDGGVHIAALGGNWMLAVMGFAGVSLRDDGLAIDPHLPVEWKRLAFRMQWRGRHVKIMISHVIEVTLENGAAMVITAAGAGHELTGQQVLRVAFKPAA